MKKLFFASALALSVAACSNSALIVEMPNSSDYRTSNALVVAGQSAVEIDEDNTEYTERKMRQAFFEGDAPIFVEGDGITAKYRYVAFDEGSQALRYLAGPIAGGSKVLLEVEFIGPEGKTLAVVRGEGSVSGGFFGGSNKSGIDKAIDKIAAYAEKEFKAQ